MNDVYHEAIAFYEMHDGPKIRGHQGINSLITSLQSQWPTEFKFVLSGPSKENHQVQVVSWTPGAPRKAPAASGMDVAIVEDGLKHQSSGYMYSFRPDSGQVEVLKY